MNAIADSDAVLQIEKIFSQHHAAIQLLLSRMADRRIQSFAWLDLACGKGQIIGQLAENVPPEVRAKIIYVGFDLSINHGRIAQKLAADLKFSGHRIEYGEIGKFSKILEDQNFDFVTLINTVHEIAVSRFPQLLFDAIASLSSRGILFVYDMEKLSPQELGAFPWRSHEIQEIIDACFGALNRSDCVPLVSSWIHSRTRGWSFSLEREYLDYNAAEFVSLREQAISAMSAKIREIVVKRQGICEAALQALSENGMGTDEEARERDNLLYEHWAVAYALRGLK